ncbi:hypothetical protein EBU71_19740 [bacterium]|nr:hypothetical protein [Candidatus Elulimicrobium humile]
MAELCFQRPIVQRRAQGTSPTAAARAAFFTKALWPVGDTIKIYFIEPVATDLEWKKPFTDDPEFLDPLYETLQGKVDPKTLIKTVVQERFAPLVNLKFVFTTDVNQSDIRILIKKGIGCSSIIGNSRSVKKISSGAEGDSQPIGQPEPTMKYGWLDVSTVLHEFGHALGMVHEHSNPENNPIKWNRPAVYCEYKKRNKKWTDADVEKNVLELYNKTDINGSEYDPASIMIYSFPKETECNEQKMPLTLNDPPIEINPNYKLSNSDVEMIKLMYPFTGKRDVKDLENIPVIPTPTYQMSADQTEAIRKFFNDNYKIIAGSLGGLVGLVIVLKLLSWLFFKKKEQRLQRMIKEG